MKLDKDLQKYGLLSMRELLDLGHWRERIKIALMYRAIVRVRRGWYALPGEPEAVMRAWRVGGRLACASAIAYWNDQPQPRELHVEVPANAAALRSPDDAGLPLKGTDRVVLHWTRNPHGDDSRAVSLRAAEAQDRRCRSRIGHRAGNIGRWTGQAASELPSKIV